MNSEFLLPVGVDWTTQLSWPGLTLFVFIPFFQFGRSIQVKIGNWLGWGSGRIIFIFNAINLIKEIDIDRNYYGLLWSGVLYRIIFFPVICFAFVVAWNL